MANDPPSSHPTTHTDLFCICLLTPRMPCQVLCECCGHMVSLVQAEKHKRELKWAKHLEDIGHTPVYTGVPIPPITTESVFGHVSPPAPSNENDNMDVDNVDTYLTSTKLPRSPPVTDIPYSPKNSHLIPDNDFQPDTGPSDRLPLPELFNKDTENSTLEGFQSLEDSAFQVELEDFGNIAYGALPILT